MIAPRLILGAALLALVSSCTAGEPAFAKDYPKSLFRTVWPKVSDLTKAHPEASAEQMKMVIEAELARNGVRLPATFVDPTAPATDVYVDVTIEPLQVRILADGRREVRATFHGPRLDGGGRHTLTIFTEQRS